MLDYNPGTVRCRTSLHRYYSMTGSVRQCVDLSPGVTGRVDRDFDYNPGN